MILIKRYPNRKFYDTASKKYVSFDEIAGFISSDIEIQIVDHRTNQDITTSVLTQIILDNNRKKGEVLPHPILKELFEFSSKWLSDPKRNIHRRLSIQEWFNDEIDRRLTGLVNEGQMDPEDGDRIFHLLTTYPPPERNARLENQIRSFLETLQIPTRQDLQGISEQLDRLQEKLDRFEQKGDHSQVETEQPAQGENSI